MLSNELSYSIQLFRVVFETPDHQPETPDLGKGRTSAMFQPV